MVGTAACDAEDNLNVAALTSTSSPLLQPPLPLLLLLLRALLHQCAPASCFHLPLPLT
jgi:hypothetical protein